MPMCLRLDVYMQTIRKNPVFPGYTRLWRDHLFLIFTLIVTFISRLFSRVILVLRMFSFLNNNYVK